MLDLFDVKQRDKFNHFLELCARRYGRDPRVIGFVVGWGYMGETGYYIGDYLTDFNRIGSVTSGYSVHALEEFNRWRRKRGLAELRELPMPSISGQSRDYILFHQFRSEYAGEVFQKEAVARVKAFTRKPVGTFGYISVNVANYGRDWAPRRMPTFTVPPPRRHPLICGGRWWIRAWVGKTASFTMVFGISRWRACSGTLPGKSRAAQFTMPCRCASTKPSRSGKPTCFPSWRIFCFPKT